MQNPNEFSVVVTSYNYRRFILEAIDSALRQTFPPLEVIVVDDGSTDGSAEFVMEKYANEPRVRVHQQQNGGQLSAFAAGVANAQARIVAFLDADDLWEPAHLANVVRVYERRAQAEFVYTDMCYFDQREGYFHGTSKSTDYGRSLIQALCTPLSVWRGSPTSALTMTRELAQRILLNVPEDLVHEFRTNADDFLIYASDMLGAHKFYLATSNVKYRAHGRNMWLGNQNSQLIDPKRRKVVDTRMRAYFLARGSSCVTTGKHRVRSATTEFLTKERPTYREFRAYFSLLQEAEESMLFKAFPTIQLCSYFIKSRITTRHDTLDWRW